MPTGGVGDGNTLCAVDSEFPVEEEGPDDEECENEDGSTSGDPVSLRWGAKSESATDIRIELPGRDFVLTRSYTSEIDENKQSRVAFSALGPGWRMSSFRYLLIHSSGDLRLIGTRRGKTARYTLDTSIGQSDPKRWVPTSSADKYIQEAVITLDGQTYPVWSLVVPGVSRSDFLRSAAIGESLPISENLVGALLREVDEYGNTWTYHYASFGDPATPATLRFRPSRIQFLPGFYGGPAGLPAAELRFEWLSYTTADVGAAINGKLGAVQVLRPNADIATDPTPSLEVVTRVEYTYRHPKDPFHGDLGNDGDLIQVTRFTLVDSDDMTGSSYAEFGPGFPARVEIWQYRYHREDTIDDEGLMGWPAGDQNSDPSTGSADVDLQYDGRLFGYKSQLKAVVRPQVFEFLATRWHRSSGFPASLAIRDSAFRYLYLADEESFMAGETAFGTADFFAKLISYRRESQEYDGLIAAQLVRDSGGSSACGSCGGSTTAGTSRFLEYIYDIPQAAPPDAEDPREHYLFSSNNPYQTPNRGIVYPDDGASIQIGYGVTIVEHEIDEFGILAALPISKTTIDFSELPPAGGWTANTGHPHSLTVDSFPNARLYMVSKRIIDPRAQQAGEPFEWLSLYKYNALGKRVGYFPPGTPVMTWSRDWIYTESEEPAPLVRELPYGPPPSNPPSPSGKVGWDSLSTDAQWWRYSNATPIEIYTNAEGIPIAADWRFNWSLYPRQDADTDTDEDGYPDKGDTGRFVVTAHSHGGGQAVGRYVYEFDDRGRSTRSTLIDPTAGTQIDLRSTEYGDPSSSDGLADRMASALLAGEPQVHSDHYFDPNPLPQGSGTPIPGGSDEFLGQRLRWTKRLTQAVGSAQHGPGDTASWGLTTFTPPGGTQGVYAYTVTVFDDLGRPIAMRHENNRLDIYLYSDQSGNATIASVYDRPSVTMQNVRASEVVGIYDLVSMSLPEASSWGLTANGQPLPGGTLTSQVFVDSSGRITRWINSDGSESRTERTYGPFATNTDPSAAESLGFVGTLQVTTYPPVALDNLAAGEIIRTAYDGAGRVIGTDRYRPDGSFTNSAELASVPIVLVGRERTGYGIHGSNPVWSERVPDVTALSETYRTEFTYDARGRLTTTLLPDGSLTGSLGYNVMGRPTGTYIQADASATPVVTAWFYYDSEAASSPIARAGPGWLRWIATPGSEQPLPPSRLGSLTGARLTENRYDFRGRKIQELPPLGPYIAYAYDDADRIVSTGMFTDREETNLDPEADIDTRVDLVLTDRDTRGRTYRIRSVIDASGPANGEYIETRYWHDSAGRVVATESSAQGMITKRAFTAFDGDATVWRTDGSSGNETYHKATTVDSDIVLEQIDYQFDAAGRNVLTTTRHHLPELTVAGDLSEPTGLGGVNPAITMFTTLYYDRSSRLVYTFDYGTNLTNFGVYGSAATPPIPGSAASPPVSEYANALVSTIEYDWRGRVDRTSDPMGRETQYLYDDLGRQIAMIEASSKAILPYTQSGVLVWDSANSRWGVDAATVWPDGSATERRVTAFAYDGLDRTISQTAFIHDGYGGVESQTTRYVYGVSDTQPSHGSLLPSGASLPNLLARIEYPGPDGEASSDPEYVEAYRYNEAGDRIGMVDQNNTVHGYIVDALGRIELDSVINAGTGIDATAQAIRYSYDAEGRLHVVETLDGINPATANILNSVQYNFTAWGGISSITQSPDGDLTSPNARTVGYNYALIPAGSSDSENTLRPASLTYPSGSLLEYGFGTAGSLDDRINRVIMLSLGEGDPALQSTYPTVGYRHLGAGRVTRVRLTSQGGDFDLDYSRSPIGDTPGAVLPLTFPGFDRYGRVVRQIWAEASGNNAWDVEDDGPFAGLVPSRPAIVSDAIGYDLSGLVTYEADVRTGWSIAGNQRRSRALTHDALGRLTTSEAYSTPPNTDGSPTSVGDPGKREWTLDHLGNWTQYREARFPDPATGGFSWLTETRDHEDNSNEITSITRSGFAPATHVKHDAAGHMTNLSENADPNLASDGDFRYTYDAWGRLVQAEKYVDDGATAQWVAVGRYRYNGRGWRVSKESDTDTAVIADGIDQRRFYYYDGQWRLLEEHIQEGYTGEPGSTFTASRIAQQMWGARYIDDAVARRIDRDPTDVEFDECYLYLTDTRFSPVALVDDTAGGGQVVERVSYEAYGLARHRWAEDVNGDGHVDASDAIYINDLIPAANPFDPFGTDDSTRIGGSNYQATADLDRDGLIGLSDNALATGNAKLALPNGWISGTDSAAGPGSPIGFTGALFDPETGLYLQRNRNLHPGLGRWTSVDPTGYAEGQNAIEYSSSQPIHRADPSGLRSWRIDARSCTITMTDRLVIRYQGNWISSRASVFAFRLEKEIEGAWNRDQYRAWSTPDNSQNTPQNTSCDPCECTSWNMRLDIKITTSNPDHVVIARPGRPGPGDIQRVDEIGGPAGKGRGGTMYVWDSASRVWKNSLGGQQVVGVHEYGHLIGLRHPSDPTNPHYIPPPRGRGVLGWTYTGDLPSLMGAGMSMRPHYYDLWTKKLDRRFHKCKPHRVN
ncbi:MAG: RHS repeat-associated core domain-containing protein [Planctomycetota bacterium]